MTTKKQPPIFIHGLWRTGSTYFWSKFKQSSDQLRCFFEPFHHSLQKSHKELHADFHKASSRFDLQFVRNNYYAEYDAGENGVEGYHWHFATDDYHITPPNPNKPIGQYISRLCQKAREYKQRPVLQFNRGILRGQWLDETFDASSLYIVRAPQDSLTSYNRLKGRTCLNYYMSCYLGIVGRNSKDALFKPLAKYLGVGFYNSKTFGYHLKHYATAFNRLAEQKRIDMFSFFWTLGLLDATKYASGVLDTSQALEQEHSVVTKQFEDTIEKATGARLDLSDLSVRPYTKGPLEVSKQAQKLIASAVALLKPNLAVLDSWNLSKQTQAQLFHNCGIVTEHDLIDLAASRAPVKQRFDMAANG